MILTIFKEAKMLHNQVHTVRIKLPSQMKGHPRWAKDGLSIAYEDEMSWKSIDLEKLTVKPDEWWCYDLGKREFS